MRHQKSGVKLGRTSSHRKAMFRNMVTSLFKYDRIHTTDTKAKALRGWADHLVGLAKRGDLHARRQALSIVREKSVVHKLFAEVAQKFDGIEGGYTRIIKLSERAGDCAPMVLIELCTRDKRGGKKESRPQKAAVPAETKTPVAKADSPVEVEKAALKAPEAEPLKDKAADAAATVPADVSASGDSQISTESKPGDLAQKAEDQR